MVMWWSPAPSGPLSPDRPAPPRHGTQTTTAPDKFHAGSNQRAGARVVRAPSRSGGDPHRAMLTSTPPSATIAPLTKQPQPRDKRR